MTLRTKLLVAALGGLLALSAATWGFFTFHEAGSGDDETPISAPQRVSMQHGAAVITLDPQAQRQAGIVVRRLARVSPQRLSAYGTVLDPQPLTQIANRYVEARAQRDTSRARLASSQLAFERASKLFHDQQNISQAALQVSEAAYRTDRAAFDAAQSQLDTLGAIAEQSWGTVLGRAVIEQSSLLQRLTSRQELLLQVTLRPGETAAPAPTDAYVLQDDGSHVPLRYISPATRTDPHIQGMSLFFTASGTAGLLPGMNVLVMLPEARTVQGWRVPQAAIVWTQGSPWAYFLTGTSRFVRHRVTADAWAGDGYAVTDPPPDSEVVVQGAQMLLSEEFRAEAQVSD